MAQREQQVEHRADAANAEPADQRALRCRQAFAHGRRQHRDRPQHQQQQWHKPHRGRQRPGIGQHRPDHQHQRQFGQLFQAGIEELHRAAHGRARVVRMRCQGLVGVPLRPGRRRQRPAVRARMLAHPLQRQASGEDGEEARGQAELRNPVGHADQAEAEKAVEPDRLVVAAAQVHHQAAGGRAEQAADRNPGNGRPQQVDRPPAGCTRAQVVQAQQAEPEHHERERRAIVQPALAGQAEADAVRVRPGLRAHVGGQHRIGRRQDRPQQHCRAQRQAEQPVTDGGHHRDHRRHRHKGEPQRQPPAPVAQRHAEAETDGEERDQQPEFGQPLEQFSVKIRVGAQHVGPVRAEQPAEREVDHRAAQRQPIEQRAGQHHRDQQHADEQRPFGE